MSEDLDAFKGYAFRVRRRLNQGPLKHRAMLSKQAPADLLEDAEEELLHVAGWTFDLWRRLRYVRARLVEAELARERHAGNAEDVGT